MDNENFGLYVTRALAVSVIVLMIIMMLAALANMRVPGSLDDLPGDLIRKAVGSGDGEGGDDGSA